MLYRVIILGSYVLFVASCGEEEPPATTTSATTVVCVDDDQDDSAAIFLQSSSTVDDDGCQQIEQVQQVQQQQSATDTNRRTTTSTSSTSSSASDLPALYLNATFQEIPEGYNRTIFIDDNFAVEFEHNGDTAKCSIDGINFATCTSPFYWHADNASDEHTIRVIRGEESEEITFTPTDRWGLADEFLHCDINIDDSMAMDDFTALVEADTIICLGENVTIYNSDATGDSGVSITAHNVTIATRYGHNASIYDDRSAPSEPALQVSGSNFSLVGTALKSSQKIALFGAATAHYVTLHSAYVESAGTGAGAGAIYKVGGASWEFFGSTIYANEGASNGAILLGVDSGTTDIESCRIEAGGGGTASISALQGSNLLIDDSDIYHTDPSGYAIYTQDGASSGAYLNVNDSRIEVAGSTALRILEFNGNASVHNILWSEIIVGDGHGGLNLGAIHYEDWSTTPNASIEVDYTVFGRSDSGTDPGYAITFEGSASSTILTAADDNYFCYQGSGNTWHPDIVVGVAQDNWSLGNQYASGVPISCPSLFE